MGDEFKKLFIVIGTKNDEFRKGLSDVEKGLNKFKGVANLALGAGTVIGGGLLAVTKNFADAGSEIYDMSKRTGMGAKTLSQLSYVASQSGSSIQGLEASVKRMQRTIYDASKGSKQAADALGNMGVKIEDIKDLSPDEQFLKMMEAIGKIEDPTERAGAAMEIFGRSGTDLLPMLDGGISAFNALREEADKTGNTFDDKTAKSADSLGDSLGTLKSSVTGLGNAVGQALAPKVEQFVIKLNNIIEKVTEWIKQNPELVIGLGKLAVVLVGAGGIFYAISAVVNVLKSMAVAMTLIQALSGPKGWITLGISAALIGGSILSINELLKTPEVPSLASGGIAMSPITARVGDTPAGEAIIPLDRLSSGETHVHVYIDGEEVLEKSMYNRVNTLGVKGYV